MEKKWIIYTGTNRLRENEVFRGHGIEFKKGYIYPVTPTVFEYLKAVRGFDICKGVGSEDIIDFPKPKTVAVSKSYEERWGKKGYNKKGMK